MVNQLPHCMHLISANDVIGQVESYFNSKSPFKYLTSDQSGIAALHAGWSSSSSKFRNPRTCENDARWHHSTEGKTKLTAENASRAALDALATLPSMQTDCAGRGIIVCGGGLRYLPSAWVCIRQLRKLGCTLDIQLWHFPGEASTSVRTLLAQHGVQCIDCEEVAVLNGVPAPKSGWELKPFSLLYSSFQEILLLDADNFAVLNPEYLFESEEFLQTGAIFWPDFSSMPEDDPAWKVCGVEYQDEPEFESGQIVIDKKRCWQALQLALWYNKNAGFYRQYFLGDKETFHIAFRLLEKDYSMPQWATKSLLGKAMLQHDFEGRLLFQHRNFAKWSLHGNNPWLEGFCDEKDGHRFIHELLQQWNGELDAGPPRHKATACHGSRAMAAAANALVSQLWWYQGEGEREVRFLFNQDGVVKHLPCGDSSKFCYWALRRSPNRPRLVLSDDKEIVAELEPDGVGGWKGRPAPVHSQGKILRISKTKRDRCHDLGDATIRELIRQKWMLRVGNNHQRTMQFCEDGSVTEGASDLEMFWTLSKTGPVKSLVFTNWDRITSELHWTADKGWEGNRHDQNRHPLLLRSLRQWKLKDHDEPPSGSKFACQADCDSQWYLDWCNRLKERPRYHRKQWEIVSIVERVSRHVKNGMDSELLMFNPTDDPLVDSLAMLGCRITCVLQEGISHLPQGLQKRKL
ncbi:MAG: alpha-1,3-mannosyltransferase family protein, partial [Prosthecobacter sp.]|nr:alpha-1,3-mannosyltransferase family protein [Prosthecobacter sp.]